MGRLLALVLLAFTQLLLFGCKQIQRAPAAAVKIACPSLVSDMRHESVCIVDSSAIVARPHDFCGMRVHTFGFVSNALAGQRVFPDQVRSAHGFLAASVEIEGDRAQELIHQEILEKFPSGQYAEISGIFVCNQADSRMAGAGVGSLRDISWFETIEFDQNGNVIRARPVSVQVDK